MRRKRKPQVVQISIPGGLLFDRQVNEWWGRLWLAHLAGHVTAKEAESAAKIGYVLKTRCTVEARARRALRKGGAS